MFLWQSGGPATFQNWWQSNSVHTLNTFHNILTKGKLFSDYFTVQHVKNHSHYPTKEFTKPFYPIINTKIKCAMMLVSGFDDSRWLQVNCNKLLFNNVFCQIFEENVTTAIYQPSPHICELDCIRINGSCVSFNWCELGKKCSPCKQHQRGRYFLTKVIDILLNKEVQAAEENNSLVTRQKSFVAPFSNLFVFMEGKFQVDKRLGACLQDNKHLVMGRVSFTCRNNVSISALLFCDAKVDCSPNDNTDENNCLCTSNDSSPTVCKHVLVKGREICSHLFYMTHDQLCVPYVFQKSPTKKAGAQQKELLCDTGVSISRELQNDLVSDCGEGFGDETKFVDNNSQHKSTCTEQGKLLCRRNEHLCFNISELCIFKLTKLFTLTPCRTGEHLHMCQNFQCNMMFKCPEYYCIPWGYTCDGKWDCPFGLDEEEKQNCGLGRICTNLFSCQKSQTCIHPGNVCDQVVDCPFYDDEELCDVVRQQCPGSCKCLALAIWCENTVVSAGLASTEFSTSLAIFLENCTFQMTPLLFRSGIKVSITHCGLTKICDLVRTISKIMDLNFGFNNATILRPKCFSPAQFTQEIGLQNNYLSTIYTSAFDGLNLLLHLDLSGNRVIQLDSNLFVSLSKLKIINLNNSKCDMLEIGRSIFQNTDLKVLKTSCVDLCCLVPECTLPQSGMHHFCLDLLPNVAVKCTFYFVSGLILVTNVLCLVLQILSIVQEINKTVVFPLVVLSINGTDTLHLVFLVTLWASDLYYWGTFPNNMTAFTSSAVCFSAMYFASAFFFMSPVIRMFKSLSRLMVVLHPLESNFLETPFLANCICLIVAVCLLVSIFCTLFTRFVYLRSYSVICLSLVDPSHSQILDNILVWFLLFLHIGIIVGQVVAHLLLAVELNESSKKVSKERSHKSVYIQLVILSVCNIVCWITFDAVFLTLMFLNDYPHLLTVYTTAVVPSINSVATTIVFVVTTIRKLLE